MKGLIIFSLILTISKLGYSQNLNSICSSVTFYNESNRNINHKCQGCSNLCDVVVTKGWYTFGLDRKLPSTCPITGSCQTQGIYWTPDAQPNITNPGPYNISICISISANGKDSDCNYSCYTIQAVFCQTIFPNVLAFEFIPTPYCSVRYCYEGLLPCQANESSITGYQPCVSAFPFNTLLNGTTSFATPYTDKLFINVTGVSAKCSILCPNGTNCSQIDGGDVFWYSGAESLPFQKSNLYYDPAKNSLYGYLEETKWISKINTYIRCHVLPSAKGLKPSFQLYTEPYYFGMYITVIQPGNLNTVTTFYDKKEIVLNLKEVNNNTAKVEVYSTIPILCKRANTKCSLSVLMAYEGNYLDLVRTLNCNPTCEGCVREIYNQSTVNPQNKATWNLITTVEDSNKQYPAKLKFELQVKYNLMVLGNFWMNLKLPTILVNYEPLDSPLRYAYSVNDPHMKTFDGTPFEFHAYSGEYVMMENNKTSLRVHAIFKRCGELFGIWWNVFCNYQLFIQSIDDVIIYDISYRSSLFYINLNDTFKQKTMLPFKLDKNNRFVADTGKPNSIQIVNTGYSFEIITHFSTKIVIHYNEKFYPGNLFIYPSKLDFMSVYGILGDYNNDTSNDLKESDGRWAQSRSEYFSFWKVENNSRPFMSLNQFYPVNNTANLTQYCRCNRTNIGTYVDCPFGLTQLSVNSNFLNAGKRSIGEREGKLSTKRLKSITDKIDRYFLHQKYKRNVGSKLKQLQQAGQNKTCESRLNITVFQTCDSAGIIDLYNIINNCNLDFNYTGTYELWVEQYYESTIDLCRNVFSEDKTYFVSKKPSEAILSTLCLNNCSNNGVCISGFCNCSIPFDGPDCSIDKSQPPVIHTTLFNNNMCDEKNDGDCTEVVLNVDRISSDTVFEYDVYYKEDNGNFIILGSYLSLGLLKFSHNLLMTSLKNVPTVPKGKLSVLFVNITIEDYTKSHPVLYSIYNSKCHTCTSNGKCYVKTGTCNINNDCFLDGDLNPNDHEMVCDHKLSKYDWSIKATAPPVSSSVTLFSAGVIEATIVSAIMLVFNYSLL